jgi:creatinine amidohydrolase/Fe(II)-dependent formamide hydrolase-like protein
VSEAAPLPSTVELELMTGPELQAALAAGKTTALFYTGGVEQRGPQAAIGGHNQMSRAIVKAIAEKLGNAIAMPVLPFTPSKADPKLPGTIGITPDLLSQILEQVSEQAVVDGFKNIVLMGDHGGGQPKAYAEVAQKLDAKYSAQGVHVFYADEVYTKANQANAKILASEGYPRGTHGGIADTSLMLYLDPDNQYIRRDQLPNALGDPVLEPGQKPDPNFKSTGIGIMGDARRASAELGKRHFGIKVDTAVKQIQGLIASPSK